MESLSEEWANRADLPPYVLNMLNSFPTALHPMAQFSAAITALNAESQFAKGYSQGVVKSKYWEVRGYNNNNKSLFHQIKLIAICIKKNTILKRHAHLMYDSPSYLPIHLVVQNYQKSE